MSRTPLHRSLRLRTMLVVIGVAVTPVILVWFADDADARVRERMTRNLERAAAEAAAADGARERATVALERGVWLRVLGPLDVVTLEVDAEAPSSLLDRWGEVFFGPDGAPTLRQWDERTPPLPERAEVAAARAGEPAAGCEEADGNKLLVCWAAAPGPAGEVVHVQESSRRAIRALYDVRYQVLKLALFTGVAGLLLGGWLGWRVVRPLERLRDALRARVDSEHPTEPIGWTRRDELGELARDIDRLLGRLAALHRALEDRAAALGERAALEAAHARATEAFVAELAHELKNPVAAIRAAAESLGSGLVVDRRRAGRLSRVLADSSARLDALLSRLLELVRVEAGLPTAPRVPVPLHELLEGLVGALRDRCEGLSFSLAAVPAVVEGVPERLEDALRNVLENAVSAAEAGELAPWVGISMRREGREVVIAVSDSGGGIAEGDLPRIFDRFFTTRASRGGTGLGLALTRAVVEAHGGTVAAASPPGGGAVITLRLPTTEAPREREDAADSGL